MNITSTPWKQLLAVLFFTVFFTQLAQAQPRRDQRPPMLPDSTRIVQMVDELSENLSLSEEQKETITALHFAHFQEVKALMEKNTEKRGDDRKVMDELRNDFDEQIKAELSDTQKKKFDKLKKNNRPGRK